MIISASRRTDIPSFHMDWFMSRVRAGYCVVVNPFNRRQVKEVSLAPADVDFFVFWTRDARPLAEHASTLHALGYRFLVHWTLTGYPRQIEPGVPPAEEILAAFKALSKRVGPGRLIWRYDPIFVSELTPFSYHVANFAALAGTLSGCTRRCVLSIADFYPKVVRRLRTVPNLRPIPNPEERPEFGPMMTNIAAAARAVGIEPVSCAERIELASYGIGPGACIDSAMARAEFGLEVTRRKDPSQRPACRCVVSRDIGVFDSCPRGCLYCYANK
ncbi:MAG: DUF1848 domain-containing protein [Kiritimatiellae bacterium]|nr:DUF1848 domain-containing protein [Kiritimatiellia bacterium]